MSEIKDKLISNQMIVNISIQMKANAKKSTGNQLAKSIRKETKSQLKRELMKIKSRLS
jgi:hypothetical protein